MALVRPVKTRLVSIWDNENPIHLVNFVLHSYRIYSTSTIQLKDPNHYFMSSLKDHSKHEKPVLALSSKLFDLSTFNDLYTVAIKFVS